jgi:hypothetical protein
MSLVCRSPYQWHCYRCAGKVATPATYVFHVLESRAGTEGNCEGIRWIVSWSLRLRQGFCIWYLGRASRVELGAAVLNHVQWTIAESHILATREVNLFTSLGPSSFHGRWEKSVGNNATYLKYYQCGNLVIRKIDIEIKYTSDLVK